MSTAATPTKLKPGQKRRYFARVRDQEGDHPIHGDDWWRATTRSNPDGLYATRAWAEDALERAIATYHKGKLIGHVDDLVITEHPTLATIDIHKWLAGHVVPVGLVPAEFREQYEDTLRRAALAAFRFGHVVWVNSSFRTRHEQEVLYARYLAGGPLAAIPGTSPHEKGIALDIPNARLTDGLIVELRKLELIDDVPSEIWHVTNHHRV